MLVCSDNAVTCTWTVMEFTVYVNAYLSRALIDKIEQTALRFLYTTKGIFDVSYTKKYLQSFEHLNPINLRVTDWR